MSLRRQRQNGFTLLELIIVLAIFGVFAAMAYGGLNHVLTTRKRLEAEMDRTAAWQKAFQRLRNDFQFVSLRPLRGAYGQPSSQPLNFDAFNSQVEFHHAGWRNPLFAPRPSIERIQVRYDSKEHQLIREGTGVMDPARDDGLRKLVLLDEITDARWRFMDAQHAWQDKWPASTVPVAAGAMGDAPLAVELTLSSKDFGQVRWVFKLGESKVPTPVPGISSGGSGSNGSSSGSSNGGSNGGGSNGGGGGNGSNGGGGGGGTTGGSEG